MRTPTCPSDPPWPSRREPGAAGFTLIELMIVVGIIALLITITLPVIGRVRDSSKRVAELSDLRQLGAACIAYAANNDGMLPQGRTTAPGDPDDYTWIGYSQCWAQLLQASPSLNNSCPSVRDTYQPTSGFGSAPTGGYDETQVGWIYWGGRDDLQLNGTSAVPYGSGTSTVAYRSAQRLGQQLIPGSRTLWTCLCWDSAGNGSVSVCPHVGTKCVTYPNGVAIMPPPDGLNVALDDGSASFVPWTDLITVQQANGFKLYYQP